MKAIAYDTETTDLPDWKQPSEAPHQPHLVEVGAILFDTDTWLVHDHFTALIRPDDWSWDATNVAYQSHGISFEQAMDEGIPEPEALAQFLALHAQAEVRVGFNEPFDARIMRIAIKRYGYGVADDVLNQDGRDAIADLFKARESYCTMWATKKAYPGVWPKVPTLSAAVLHVLGYDHDGAHRALADADAAARLYLALQDRARIPHLPRWLVSPRALVPGELDERTPPQAAIDALND